MIFYLAIVCFARAGHLGKQKRNNKKNHTETKGPYINDYILYATGVHLLAIVYVGQIVYESMGRIEWRTCSPGRLCSMFIVRIVLEELQVIRLLFVCSIQICYNVLCSVLRLVCRRALT